MCSPSAILKSQPYKPLPHHPDGPADQPGLHYALRNSVADVAIDVDDDWLYSSDVYNDDD